MLVMEAVEVVRIVKDQATIFFGVFDFCEINRPGGMEHP